MCMRDLWLAAALLALLAPLGLHAQPYGIGKPASEHEIAGWNIDVTPDGRGLPKGSGSVAQGKLVYDAQCASCHGPKGEGKPADRLVGGKGTLATGKPIRTVGSFWPYATTVYDYVYRAMPYNAPLSLKDEEVYGAVAYVLFLNSIIGENDPMNAQTLPKVQMPNKDGFVNAYKEPAAR